MLAVEKAAIVVIDVQGLLAKIMFNRDFLFDSLKKLILGSQELGIPILWLEQNPERMGGTVREIASLLEGEPILSKMTFSCCGQAEFLSKIHQWNRSQIVLSGIETHVCVYQTAMDLLAKGYEVQVAADAVSSRTKENREIGLLRMTHEGVKLTSVEMVLFEIIRTAECGSFRQILKIIK